MNQPLNVAPATSLPKLSATYNRVETILLTNHHAVGVEVPPWITNTPAGLRLTVPNRSSATFIAPQPFLGEVLPSHEDGSPHMELTRGDITESPSIGTPWQGRPFRPAFEYTDDDVAASPVPSDNPWKRNYSSSYTGLIVRAPALPKKAITFNHSENYSMVVLDTISHRTPDVPGTPTAYYRSTFYPNTPTKMANLYGHSYFERQPSLDGKRLLEFRYPRWDNYSAFVTMSLGDLGDEEGNPVPLDNCGPVVWPSRGYTSPHTRTVRSQKMMARWFHADEETGGWNYDRYRWVFHRRRDPDLHWVGNPPKDKGVRHPSVVVHQGWVWLFYIDTGATAGEGEEFPEIVNPVRAQGVKLARAPLKALVDGKIDFDTFKVYCEGRTWQPGLPEGFDKAKIADFMQKPGPAATPLFGGHLNRDDGTELTARFSVAKIRGRDLFLGVEQYSRTPHMDTYIGLRVSEDLIHWSERTELDLPGISGGKLFPFAFKYPVFLDADGTDSFEIDPEEFYILGAEHKEHSYGERWRHPQLKYPFPQTRTYPVNRLKLSITLD